MKCIRIFFFSFIILINYGCQQLQENKSVKLKVIEKKESTVKIIPEKKKSIQLNDKNAIPFLFKYGKENKEDKIRIITKFGNIDIKLFEKTPYHRANFIYLTKKKYFDGTMFHRVVPGFIIQGGNSDSRKSMSKRQEIGRYLLPPDTKKGYSHHRGVVSMPSSEIDNPYKLASPYEFFIVQQSPGAYHLDGNYTAFGKVIEGMNVVDKISEIEIDKREMPISNIYIKTIIID